MKLTDRSFVGILALLFAIQLPTEGFILILSPIFIWDYFVQRRDKRDELIGT